MPDEIDIPSDGEYAQLFCFRIDMVGSELVLASTSPGRLREMNAAYRDAVERRVAASNGRMAAWHGDGSVAFFATTADEDPLIRIGEAAAREILDGLFARLPDKRFRIGVGTSPARYWENVETINTPGVVRAARLESYARRIIRGSVLLIPDDVFSALASDVQSKYVELPGALGVAQLYAYIPTGAGERIPPPPAQERTGEAPMDGGTSPAPTTLFGQSPIPAFIVPTRIPGWPESNFPYLAIDSHPESRDHGALFDVRRDEDWIMQRILSLPIGTPLFREVSLSNNTLTVYVAEREGGKKFQICRFMSTGRVFFGDCGWTNLGWQGVFYPQVLRTILPKVIEFGCAYFKERLNQSGRAWFRVELGNITGCERKVQRIGAVPPRNYVFEREIAAAESFELATGDQAALAKTIYDKVMLDSELDPQYWGYESEPGQD